MTITIEKKHLYIFIGIITLVLIVFCGVKACEKPDYEANANEMKINTMAACYMAADILSDYQKSWSNAIENKNVKNVDGEWVAKSEHVQSIRTVKSVS